jgi:hypothetical protein
MRKTELQQAAWSLADAVDERTMDRSVYHKQMHVRLCVHGIIRILEDGKNLAK